ncbi:hypothetical protein LTR66_007640 [Elasticomyces elasticus]|nr:hypothetical protein LTR66_007640 [Elasticomyces elasticus]KAK5006478.1 hypothetical protein LTR28_006447 [Elasticomyces elasticus]
MARVGILGDLRYDGAVYSWALDLGALLARLEFLNQDFTAGTIRGFETARHGAVRDINEKLLSHKMDYTVLENLTGGDTSIKEVMQNVLGRMQWKESSAHAAFLLIGGADCLLGLSGSSKSNDANERIIALARNRVEAIHYHCGEIDVNTEALFDLLAEPPYGPLVVREKLRRAMGTIIILFVLADPKNADRLRLQEERRTLDEIARSSKIHGAFAIRDLQSCRTQDLSRGLREHLPTIVHFSGHGAAEGLCFEGDNGNAQIVDPKALANLLSLACKNGLKGVIMNACYSEVQAEHIADAVEHVIAMEGALADRDAISFTREFYGALGSGDSFNKAFVRAVAGAGIDPETSALKPRLIKTRPGPALSTDGAVLQDLQSFAASSLPSKLSTPQQIAHLAAQEIINLLLADNELQSLYLAAAESDAIRKERAERNFRRLLHVYSVDLKKEAKTKEHLAAVHLVRSCSRFIAKGIMQKVSQQSKDNNWSEKLQRLSETNESKLKVGQYPKQLHEVDVRPKAEEPSEFLEIEDKIEVETDSDNNFSDKSNADEQDLEPLTELSHVKDFMVLGLAFVSLRKNFQDFVNPSFKSKLHKLINALTMRGHEALIISSQPRLRSLVTELQHVQPTQISISYEEKFSIANYLKGIVEDRTGEAWEWWPFESRLHALSPGQARLRWRCVGLPAT